MLITYSVNGSTGNVSLLLSLTEEKKRKDNEDFCLSADLAI